MEDSGALEAFDWWLGSSPFNGTTGGPSGPPEWPGYDDSPGVVGMLRQPNRLVEAVHILRSGFARAMSRRAEAARSAPAAERPRATRSRRHR